MASDATVAGQRHECSFFVAGAECTGIEFTETATGMVMDASGMIDSKMGNPCGSSLFITGSEMILTHAAVPTPKQSRCREQSQCQPLSNRQDHFEATAHNTILPTSDHHTWRALSPGTSCTCTETPKRAEGSEEATAED